MASLSAELSAVRAATLSLAESFDESALARRGLANDNAGERARAVLDHRRARAASRIALLRERYGLKG